MSVALPAEREPGTAEDSDRHPAIEMFSVAPKAKKPFVALTQHGLHLQMRKNFSCLYSSFFLGQERLEML